MSPVSPREIILGRAEGIWRQILPAALVLLALNLTVLYLEYSTRARAFENCLSVVSIDWVLLVTLLTIPIYATYASLRLKSTLGAVVLAWLGVAIASVPGFVFFLTVQYLTPRPWQQYFAFAPMQQNILDNGYPWCGFAIAFTTASAAVCGLTFFLLRRSLSRRIYSV